MLVALILVSIGFAITLYMLLFGEKRGGSAALPASPSVKGELEEASKARGRAESELQRKQKELDEQRTQLQEVKEQLKQTKRKLFEQKEGDKGASDLTKARAEVERSASTQLEVVRSELAQALAEIDRLKAQGESGRGRRGAPAPAPVVAAVVPAATPPALAPEASASPVPAAEGARRPRHRRRPRRRARARGAGPGPLPRPQRRGPRAHGEAGGQRQQGAHPRLRAGA